MEDKNDKKRGQIDIKTEALDRSDSRLNKSNLEESDVVSDVVYVGPTIRNTVTTNTVFKSGVPEALKDKIREYPYLKALLVDVSDYALALAEIRNNNSAMATLYKKAVEEVE